MGREDEGCQSRVRSERKDGTHLRDGRYLALPQLARELLLGPADPGQVSLDPLAPDAGVPAPEAVLAVAVRGLVERVLGRHEQRARVERRDEDQAAVRLERERVRADGRRLDGGPLLGWEGAARSAGGTASRSSERQQARRTEL